jgi:hypothetical protein
MLKLSQKPRMGDFFAVPRLQVLGVFVHFDPLKTSFLSCFY